MSATVVTNRLAAVLEQLTPKGAPIWCLFEESYEKNVYPHRPSWSCVLLGDLSGALDRIFGYAADCESGMVQTRRGATTPESYIKSWLAAMRKPYLMPDVEINLRKAELLSSYAVSWAYEKDKDGFWSTFQERLSDLGRADVCHKLNAGKTVTVSLRDDLEIILALAGSRAGDRPLFAPWGVIRAYDRPRSGDPVADASLAYLPKRARIPESSVPLVLALNAHERVLVEQGGKQSTGSIGYVVKTYVRDLWKEELRYPGCHAPLIQAFRAAAKDAALVPPGSEAVVTLAQCSASERNRAVSAATALGGVVSESEVRVAWTAENCENITQLPYDRIRWEFATSRSGGVASETSQTEV